MRVATPNDSVALETSILLTALSRWTSETILKRNLSAAKSKGFTLLNIFGLLAGMSLSNIDVPNLALEQVVAYSVYFDNG